MIWLGTLIGWTSSYLLGASIKDAGNKGFTIVPLQEASIVRFILDHADPVWASATPLLCGAGTYQCNETRWSW
jgi:hypothetical protein